ncbi:MAG: uracil phosphoribosyltransferase [Rikenellaceae bacterium]
MVNVVSNENSLLSMFVRELRDSEVQTDPLRFRRNLERTGEVLAYEISKTLDYKKRMVTTPLGETEVAEIEHGVVLATILRAGIPFHNGFLNYFDRADNAFVSAYRKNHKDNTFEIKLEYVSCGDIEGKTLILVDPMLATGSSAVLAYRALCEQGGKPRHTHIASVIASEQGVEYLRQHLALDNVTIWTAALDEELTSKSYIVPGLGDAGDLAYGKKK